MYYYEDETFADMKTDVLADIPTQITTTETAKLALENAQKALRAAEFEFKTQDEKLKTLIWQATATESDWDNRYA